ncbi:hypothetical protein SAMN05216548_11360 [Faunimonas pinastri]|uniref:1,4-alpha-glucan branching enzyme n=1 Tax=Faunimonas pinastri TaxID=1855383 RepID=A0A1H9MD32_9HYPH|nr:hypothetical protein [Faunimonas pinastri]SER21365.1 hypothetical protein SAMN05216548_11360 [Faunimonas pinastri]
MSSAEKITDHKKIRKWAEDRGGRPSVAKGTEKGGEGAGVLRFDFGPKEDSLEEIDWDAFFETFEEKKLALLAQEKTADGKESRFFKFVERD